MTRGAKYDRRSRERCCDCGLLQLPQLLQPLRLVAVPVLVLHVSYQQRTFCSRQHYSTYRSTGGAQPLPTDLSRPRVQQLVP